jgi:DNA modification methylase
MKYPDDFINKIITGRKFIGIEKEPEYVEIAEARIKPYLEQNKLNFENGAK